MIKQLCFSVICLVCACTARAQFLYQPGGDTARDACVVGRREAIKDIKAGTMRFFSMGMLSSAAGISNHFRREHFGLKVRLGGCIVDEDVICYNKTVDSFFHARGVDLDAEVSRKVDSFDASVPRQKLPQLYNSLGINYETEDQYYEAPKELWEERIRKELE